jgi:hypothetical protein
MEFFLEMFELKKILSEENKGYEGVLVVCGTVRVAVHFAIPRNGNCLISCLVYDGTGSILMQEGRSS